MAKKKVSVYPKFIEVSSKKLLTGYLIEFNDVIYFKKIVSRRKHFFKILSGYAIDYDVYMEIRHKIKGILIQEKDTGNKLFATIDVWDSRGGSGDWGSGKQKTLSEKFMSQSRNKISKI